MPMLSATRSQVVSLSPSSCRRYTVVTANELWSRKRLTCSTDSPASRRSLAAEWRKMWTPVGRRPAALKYRRRLPSKVPLVMPRSLSAMEGHRDSSGFVVARFLPKASSARCMACSAGWGNSRLPCLPPLPR